MRAKVKVVCTNYIYRRIFWHALYSCLALDDQFSGRIDKPVTISKMPSVWLDAAFIKYIRDQSIDRYIPLNFDIALYWELKIEIK